MPFLFCLVSFSYAVLIRLDAASAAQTDGAMDLLVLLPTLFEVWEISVSLRFPEMALGNCFAQLLCAGCLSLSCDMHFLGPS